MKKMNAKELFELLYDEKISDEECIEVIHPAEEDHFILRDGCLKKFDEYELLGCLLFLLSLISIVSVPPFASSACSM